jgi:hypothetical protein
VVWPIRRRGRELTQGQLVAYEYGLAMLAECLREHPGLRRLVDANLLELRRRPGFGPSPARAARIAQQSAAVAPLREAKPSRSLIVTEDTAA